FIPRPKVQSAFISIEKRSDFNKNDVNIKKFSQVVRMAFNQRRKMLRNSLSTLNIDLDVCKVDFKRRPEQLTVSEFIDISNNII
ncbi:MAG: 16S rRNA (adenine(1518)-N(6)/adenine(1519)-N(6))-dimethyltransferase, partial [Flavobacteriales bacterium]|nr:16S rRNA (adenine(1518)-N(6)/adenine(1519)-N(6))-dimethyltransferase [Flavobacteriales bacterium]